MTLNKKKVIVGLSGGVDSASAVLRLQADGFEVIGLYFDVLYSKGTINELNLMSEGHKAALSVAEKTGIQLIYKNVSQDFDRTVINDFCKEYTQGRTPNPCIKCNPTIKFPTLIEEANKQGAYYIATGHYANIHHEPTTKKYFLKQGENIKKDQSYMLYRLGSETLARLIFPLGQVKDKAQVRQLAKDGKLPNADRKDSQEICFVQGDYRDIIYNRGGKQEPGDFIDQEGNIIGSHNGIENYTVGQRKGLGLAFGKPMYVLSLDYKNNRVILGENQDLYQQEVYSLDNIFTATGNSTMPSDLEGSKLLAKIRYTAKPALGRIYKTATGVRFQFDEKQRGPSPGQSIVFYKDNIVLGGGFIV